MPVNLTPVVNNVVPESVRILDYWVQCWELNCHCNLWGTVSYYLELPIFFSKTSSTTTRAANLPFAGPIWTQTLVRSVVRSELRHWSDLNSVISDLNSVIPSEWLNWTRTGPIWTQSFPIWTQSFLLNDWTELVLVRSELRHWSDLWSDLNSGTGPIWTQSFLLNDWTELVLVRSELSHFRSELSHSFWMTEAKRWNVWMTQSFPIWTQSFLLSDWS
jgi:hypothetical protein